MRATKYVKGTIAVAMLCMATVIAVNTTDAQVVTEPVGFYQTALLTNSDTFLSFPFTAIAPYQGLVGSVNGATTLAVSNTPGWAANQWATPTTPNNYYPYYVEMISGAKEGATYTITNNDAASVSVVLVPENLSGVAAGDQIRIIPFWTLGTTFPSGTGVVATTTAAIRKTEILFPNLAGIGQNLSASASYFFFNTAWRKVGASTTSNFNDTVVLPGQYIIARQSNQAGTSTNTGLGQVLMTKLRIPLYANPPTPTLTNQDNYVAIYRPAVQTLNQSALASAIKTTTVAAIRQDVLLTFDNTATAKNKAASGTYFFFNNGWRKVGVSTLVDYGPTNIFLPGTGSIVRRTTNSVPASMWANSANYAN